MIKNRKEYEITRAQVDRFRRSLEALEVGNDKSVRDSLVRKAQKDAIVSQIADLNTALEEYDKKKEVK